MKEVKIVGVPEHFNFPWHMCIENSEFNEAGIDLQWTNVPKGTEGSIIECYENPEGYAVVKTNEWYYDVWKFGKHRGKMDALRQVRPFLISRDGNKDKKVDETAPKSALVGINFHANTYNMANTEIKEIIGGWSLGCQVCNNTPDYVKIINYVKPQRYVTYCLLKEF